MSYARESENVSYSPGIESWRNSLNSNRTSLQITFRHIVYATDFSAIAERALPYAVEIARRSQSTIHAVHVAPSDVYPEFPPGQWPENPRQDEEFRAQKQNQVELELQGLPHEFLSLKGDAAEGILKMIREKSADLAVLGTQGRTGIAKALMGSVAEQVFRQATCPVLLVGPDVSVSARHAAAAELNCILYATDFTPESLAAARYAISLAKDHHAELVLLHATGEGREEDGLSLETLRNVVPLGAGLWSKPACIVEHDAATEAILKTAKRTHADLIVLGARGVEKHLTVATHLPDSIVARVAAGANSPVLIIHT